MVQLAAPDDDDDERAGEPELPGDASASRLNEVDPNLRWAALEAVRGEPPTAGGGWHEAVLVEAELPDQTRRKIEDLKAAGRAISVSVPGGQVVVGAPAPRPDRGVVRDVLASWSSPRLHEDDRYAIRMATTLLRADSPLGRLVRWAQVLAHQIEASPTWGSDYMSEVRDMYRPRREADDVRFRALELTAMGRRIQGGEAVSGDAAEIEAAREIIDDQLAVLGRLVASLTDRVAAMWVYRHEIDRLDKQLAALAALDRGHDVYAELDALAQRQLGVDELAVEQLGRLDSQAEVLREQIAVLLRTITKALPPAE